MSYPSAPEWAMNIRCLTTGVVLPVRVSKAPPPVLLARDQERSICVGPIRPQDLIKDNFALRLIRMSPASAASRRLQESAGCCLRLLAWSPILGPTRCHTAFLPNHAGNRCAIASTPSRMRGPRSDRQIEDCVRAQGLPSQARGRPALSSMIFLLWVELTRSWVRFGMAGFGCQAVIALALRNVSKGSRPCENPANFC